MDFRMEEGLTVNVNGMERERDSTGEGRGMGRKLHKVFPIY